MSCRNYYIGRPEATWITYTCTPTARLTLHIAGAFYEHTFIVGQALWHHDTTVFQRTFCSAPASLRRTQQSHIGIKPRDSFTSFHLCCFWLELHHRPRSRVIPNWPCSEIVTDLRSIYLPTDGLRRLFLATSFK